MADIRIFPNNNKETQQRNGLILCLNQLAEECLEGRYVTAAHMLKATVEILKKEPADEDSFIEG